MIIHPFQIEMTAIVFCLDMCLNLENNYLVLNKYTGMNSTKHRQTLCYFHMYNNFLDSGYCSLKHAEKLRLNCCKITFQELF